MFYWNKCLYISQKLISTAMALMAIPSTPSTLMDLSMRYIFTRACLSQPLRVWGITARTSLVPSNVSLGRGHHKPMNVPTVGARLTWGCSGGGVKEGPSEDRTSCGLTSSTETRKAPQLDHS